MNSDHLLVWIRTPTNHNSLAALAGSLSGLDLGIQPATSILDLTAGWIDRIMEFGVKYRKLALIFSFMSWDIIQVSDQVGRLKRRMKDDGVGNVWLIAGGSHASGDWETTAAIGFDVVATGEGEQKIRRIATSLMTDSPLRASDGFAFSSDKGLTAPETVRDMVDLDQYSPFSPQTGWVGAIEISRGCSCNCAFCQVSSLMGSRMRHRSIGAIIEAVRVFQILRTPYVRFISPNAFAYGSDGIHPAPDCVEEMLRKIKESFPRVRIFLGSFPSEVRPEWVTSGLLDKIRPYVSNTSLVIGAQSGSERILASTQRNHTVADIINSARITLESGLIPIFDFIFGLPGEEESDIIQTIDLVERLAAMGCRIHSHSFMPLPGSRLADRPAGQIPDKYISLLLRYEGKGMQFGQWRRQHQRAIRIGRFLERLRQNLHFPSG